MVCKWFFEMFIIQKPIWLIKITQQPFFIIGITVLKVRPLGFEIRQMNYGMGWVGFYLQGSKLFEVHYIWVRPNPNYNISINSTYALPTLPWYQQYLVYQTHIMNITYLLGMKSLHPYIQLGAQAQTKQININGSER